MAEPFAVILHAVNRAGPLLGKRVLVTGCGPIGALAREVVATDVMDAVLRKATEIGADRVINVAGEPGELARYSANKGYFDVQFEASGNERAVRSGLEVLRPRSTLVQLGLAGDLSIPQNMVVAKEIEMKGTFRFHEEFRLATDLINHRRVDLKPLLTGTYPIENAVNAFEVAGDRNRSMKVQSCYRDHNCQTETGLHSQLISVAVANDRYSHIENCPEHESCCRSGWIFVHDMDRGSWAMEAGIYVSS